MELSYAVDHSQAATRVYLTGEIDLAVADQLADVLTALLNQPPAVVVVDLTDVSFLDSQGIRALMNSYKFATERQQSLTVENPVPFVKRVLEICGVTALLNGKAESATGSPSARLGPATDEAVCPV